MVRQAHSYLAGAVSGAALIAAAVVVFVVLVSAQVFRDWPISGLGGGGSPSISPARPAVQAGATASPAGAGGAGVVNRAGAGHRSARSSGSVAQQGDASGGSGKAAAPGSAGSNQGPGKGSPSPGSASGGGGDSGSTPSGKGNGGGSSPSAVVAGTVNDTVGQVDQGVLGGALQGSGVTGVAQGAVNGDAGPNSTAGQAVDKAAGAVGALPVDGH